MNTKSWYTSKTLWLNLITILALGIQTINTSYVISPEIQCGLLAIINLILRAVTSQAIDWSTPSQPAPDKGSGEGLGSAGNVRLSLLVVLAFMGLWLITACATTTPTPSTPSTVTTAKDNPMALAGKSLLAVKSTIVTAATATDALCKAGKIGPDKCAQAKDAYNLAKPAYDSAVDAYLLMSQGYGDAAAFGAALGRVQAIAANLLALSGGAN